MPGRAAESPGAFQSTPPARGATVMWRHFDRDIYDFNPRPPRGGRQLWGGADTLNPSDFNPRPPRGGRRRGGGSMSRTEQFQSTPPARGATALEAIINGENHISIHAPREGGDYADCRVSDGGRYFNPRPPRGGRRHTLYHSCDSRNFNPRPPRGGRPDDGKTQGADQLFQSTPPARGATLAAFLGRLFGRISIHAPREGGDLELGIVGRSVKVISIHAPREGGDEVTPMVQTVGLISIHAPREGGDGSYVIVKMRCDDFNPRPPRGGRP